MAKELTALPSLKKSFNCTVIFSKQQASEPYESQPLHQHGFALHAMLWPSASNCSQKNDQGESCSSDQPQSALLQEPFRVSPLTHTHPHPAFAFLGRYFCLLSILRKALIQINSVSSGLFALHLEKVIKHIPSESKVANERQGETGFCLHTNTLCILAYPGNHSMLEG